MITPYRHGLPTRARHVAEFMIGLEKNKAKAGEVSHSARAVDYDNMLRLHYVCVESEKLTKQQRQQGTVRYVCFLFHSSVIIC